MKNLDDPHLASILDKLGDARSHFRIVPVSKNTLYVRRYRHKLRLAKLAALRAADTATNDGAGSRRRSGAGDPTAIGNGGRPPRIGTLRANPA